MTDFSRLPQDVLAANVSKGYIGLHIEQGVPILDRDLNLLQDLLTAAVRSIVTRYIGNGIPSGGQGFAIQAIPAANNFRIVAGVPPPGACLVGGIEVTIPADLNYSDQPGVPALTTPTPCAAGPSRGHRVPGRVARDRRRHFGRRSAERGRHRHSDLGARSPRLDGSSRRERDDAAGGGGRTFSTSLWLGSRGVGTSPTSKPR